MTTSRAAEEKPTSPLDATPESFALHLWNWLDSSPEIATAVIEEGHRRGREATAATPSLDANYYDDMRVRQAWPTPNSMRHAADALDALVIPRYGDVLRWFADLCDGHLARLDEGSATPDQPG